MEKEEMRTNNRRQNGQNEKREERSEKRRGTFVLY